MSYENRNLIPEAYKWDLSSILAGDKAWEDLFEEVSAKAEQYGQYVGKLADPDLLFEYLEFDTAVNLDLERLYVYAKMKKDEDGSQAKYAGMTDRAVGLLTRLSAASSFALPEISALSEKTLRGLSDQPRFAAYRRMFGKIIRERAHILSAPEEKLLSLSGEISASFRSIFDSLDNVDMTFEEVEDEHGTSLPLSHGSYSVFLQSPDQGTRRRAFETYYKSYEGVIHTLASIYAASVKKDCFYKTARGFESCMASALFSEEVDVAVYRNLLDAVNKGLPALHEYMALRKKVARLKELHMYDMHFPLFKGAELKLDFEEAFALVKEGLKPMGEEYADLLQRAHDERWMDVYENKGKRTGAYSWGCYKSHPYVLLNHEKTTHSVFTIAHELGHAMHSYYSNTSLPPQTADYTIFVAEVASTVNEVLLLKHILSTTQDNKMKKFLLSYYLDMFRTTFFRQTQFSEFEALAHEMAEQGRPLTVESLSKVYGDLNRKYYGPACTYDKAIEYEWARIPHFYTAFYVYKYATGITSAVSIARGILSQGEKAVEQYKKFLRSGGSADPVSLLKIAGVDLSTPVPFETAIAEFSDTLAELKALTE